MSSFKQFTFQPCEPKKPKPTDKTFKVNSGTGIKNIHDKNKHALARGRWGNKWFEKNKKERLEAQAAFRAKNDEDAVFGGSSSTGETKSSTGETKSPERNVYRVYISWTEDEELIYLKKSLDGNKLLNENFQLPKRAKKQRSIGMSGQTDAPDYWTPHLQKNWDEDSEFPLVILSQSSELDGAHVLAAGDNFEYLKDPNDVIEQLFATFRTGFGPYVENKHGNRWSFDINNNLFMIDVELFNLLNASSRQKLCGPIGENSLSFPNIWICSEW